MSRRLTFCSNILPGSGFDEHFLHLENSLPEIKSSCPWLDCLGLRLSQPMAARFSEDEHAVRSFNQWLRENSLRITTVNIFPFDDFSSEGLKDKVYLPDWSSKKRRDYTISAAKALTQLETAEVVSMSTVPLGYKFHYEVQDFSAFHDNLVAALEALHDLRDQKLIRLCLEPEPDCVLENRFEVISFFEQIRKTVPLELLQHLGICFDTCHFAVNFEETDRALFELQQAEVPIFKFQLSSALKWRKPLSSFSHKTLLDPVYLHQSRLLDERGRVQFEQDVKKDLEVLNSMRGEWRCHFHAPIFLENYAEFESTQKDIVDAMAFAKTMNLCECDYEVETYTWSVLPGGHKGLKVEDCIVSELNWARQVIDG